MRDVWFRQALDYSDRRNEFFFKTEALSAVSGLQVYLFYDMNN